MIRYVQNGTVIFLVCFQTGLFWWLSPWLMLLYVLGLPQAATRYYPNWRQAWQAILLWPTFTIYETGRFFLVLMRNRGSNTEG